MRIPRVILVGVVTAGLAVAGIAALARIRDLGSRLERQAAQVERAEKQTASLQAGALALERAAREARQAAQVWSNRCVKAQAELAEERGTHEPLRQQIERMMQQEVVFKSQLEKKDSALRNTDEGVANLRHDLEAARSLATAHAGRIAGLESEAKSRTESLEALRKSLDEAKQATAAAKAGWDQTKKRLAAAESQVAELKRIAAQPPTAPASTNAPTSSAGN